MMVGHITLPPISSGRGAMVSSSFPPPAVQNNPSRGESRPSSSSSSLNSGYHSSTLPTPLGTRPTPSREYCVFRNNGGTSQASRHPGRLPALHSPSKTPGGLSPSSNYFRRPRVESSLGGIKRAGSEECLKCMLKVAHNKCEAHKYIRVGGGYRHSYWYVKAMLEEIELQRAREELQRQRLEAIQEKQVRAIKTYIRTKSGRLVERVVFMSEDDYTAFKAGNKDIVSSILKKYLSKDEAKGLESWDKEEQKAITTFVRTKSGKLVERVVYVSKDDYENIKAGKVDANSILKKYVKAESGEKLEGWGEAEMKAITTYVRTKSGRLVEKTIMVSKADYEKLQKVLKDGGDAEKMAKILGNYMSVNDGEKIEGFKKKESAPMKVVKAMVRTKSGRLVEKTILMTEEEYKTFQDSGGDVTQLKKYLNLGRDDVIENWEKASTVYSASDDEIVEKGIPGTRVVGKDGKVYEIVVDPITGKKYKKKVGGKESDIDSGFASMNQKNRGKIGKGNIVGATDNVDPNEAGMSKEQVAAYRAGKRREDSASDFSYRSVVSAGGTRHVKRRRKRGDGTYSAEESYHSDQDEEGKKRRQKRRQERKVKAVKEKKERIAKGKRNKEGSESDYSYRSVVSAGGTRRVRRRKKNVDGTYGDDESYHSSQDEEGQKRRKKRRQKRMEAIRQGKRNPGSDSDYSYRSVVSAGGTRHVKRRKKFGDGKYGDEESYHSSQDEGGKERRRKRRAERQKKFKEGKRRPDSESDYSYRSVVSAGGTRRVRRKKKNADGTYADSESYHSSQDEDGETRRRRRRRERKHEGSAHSYYSVVSEGGTRRVRRKKKRKDGTYSSSESYHSDDSNFFDEKKLKRRKKRHEHGSDSEYSYQSEVSAGGTKHRTRRKRIRDAHGKVIGHGKKEQYTSPSEYETDSNASSYEIKPDGKGGYVKVKKEKKGKGGKGGKGKGKGGKRGGGPDGNMTDFSDSLLSTDSEDEPDLTKMTEEEKKKYFEEKAKRKAEREKKRREKYGEKYEEMVEKHKKAKAAKSMVTYEKGRKGRFGEDEYDEREIGLAHEQWGGKKGKKKGKGGSDDDMESYVDEHGVTRRRKKKDDDEESLYEYARDKDGKILYDDKGKPIMKKVGYAKKGRKGQGIVDSDDEFEYKYDDHGNLVRKKKGEEDPDSDGDYFETLPDGTVKLRAGKKKIDISKLSKEDLKKLGIDPANMSKEEIARVLKEKFGEDIKITKAGHKIGLKHADEMKGYNTDDYAEDSDVDTSTLTGQRRVRVLMKKGGQPLMDHIKKVIETSKLTDPDKAHPDERDASINFLQHYRLVDPSKLDVYVRAFVVEDDDMDAVIYPREARRALEGVPSISDISPKQLQYILKLLDIDNETSVTFRMFAVMVALSERVTKMDQHCKHLLEICDLTDIQRKMELYKAMFYCNVPGDRDPNYIKADSLRIELMAGGLNWEQQEYIMEKMQPNEWREVSFFDYLVYIPLFMSMHDNVCSNPLDMSYNKYTGRAPSPQRDMNPLGYHLDKNSPFIKQNIRAAELKHHADSLSGRKKSPDDDITNAYHKYKKLPHIGASGKT